MDSKAQSTSTEVPAHVCTFPNREACRLQTNLLLVTGYWDEEHQRDITLDIDEHFPINIAISWDSNQAFLFRIVIPTRTDRQLIDKWLTVDNWRDRRLKWNGWFDLQLWLWRWCEVFAIAHKMYVLYPQLLGINNRQGSRTADCLTGDS